LSGWILGLGLSHDASACLMHDGSLVVGIQLERLTGRKHDGRTELANQLIDYCLEYAAIGRDSLDAIGLSHPELHHPSDMSLTGLDTSTQSVLHVGHHLAHAYSAFAPSGFQEAAVLVIDGHGDSYYEDDADRLIWGPEMKALLAAAQTNPPDLQRAPRTEVESLYEFGRLRQPVLVKRNFMGYGRRATRHRGRFVDLGIGANYKFVSSVLFGPGDHSGKVMGLAPYGDPSPELPKSYILTATGPVLDDLWRHEVRRQLYERPDRRHRHKWAANLAAYIQRETEELVTLLAMSAAHIQPNLCMAGGVALNATTNGVLESKLGYQPYVQPASSDAGLALGAAYAAFHMLTGTIQGSQPARDDLGKRYSSTETRRAIDQVAEVDYCPEYNDLNAVARAIADGAIVGYFEGGSEFGPRALGHRSILADPRRPTSRERLNLEIKGREWFRPFAPVVLEEDASHWFTPGGQSYSMTTTTYVQSTKRHLVPAVSHVDGSARIQLLGDSEGHFRELLECFRNETGIPMLINTSFNQKDRPIVESPRDAIDACVNLGLDVLWIDGYGVVPH